MTPPRVAQHRGTRTLHARHTHPAHALYTPCTCPAHALHTRYTSPAHPARAAHAHVLTGHSQTCEHMADPEEVPPAKETRPPLSLQSRTWPQLRAQEEPSASRRGAFVLTTPGGEAGGGKLPRPPAGDGHRRHGHSRPRGMGGRGERVKHGEMRARAHLPAKASRDGAEAGQAGWRGARRVRGEGGGCARHALSVSGVRGRCLAGS